MPLTPPQSTPTPHVVSLCSEFASRLSIDLQSWCAAAPYTALFCKLHARRVSFRVCVFPQVLGIFYRQQRGHSKTQVTHALMFTNVSAAAHAASTSAYTMTSILRLTVISQVSARRRQASGALFPLKQTNKQSNCMLSLPLNNPFDFLFTYFIVVRNTLGKY